MDTQLEVKWRRISTGQRQKSIQTRNINATAAGEIVHGPAVSGIPSSLVKSCMDWWSRGSLVHCNREEVVFTGMPLVMSSGHHRPPDRTHRQEHRGSSLETNIDLCVLGTWQRSTDRKAF